jgi:Fe-S oxidoreductase
MLTKKPFSGLLKKVLKVAPQRDLPVLHAFTLKDWLVKERERLLQVEQPVGRVMFFVDEFTNFNDVTIGIKAIELLHRLGYIVEVVDHLESGRAALSKGLLPLAKKCADKNVETFSKWISKELPLLGLEPSAILTFRDEYPRLVDSERREAARQLAQNCLLLEEFIYREVQAGNIRQEQFTLATRKIKLHGHCHQKALSSVDYGAWILQLPQNYSVDVIPSGCCGMAGSFGYEQEHYEVSMNIGELVLFPAVRAAGDEVIIAAPGTSCRHQIKDGTGRKAMHPVEVLFDALV